MTAFDSDYSFAFDVAVSKETGRAVFNYGRDWMSEEMVLDVPATIAGWEEFVSRHGEKTEASQTTL